MYRLLHYFDFHLNSNDFYFHVNFVFVIKALVDNDCAVISRDHFD